MAMEKFIFVLLRFKNLTLNFILYARICLFNYFHYFTDRLVVFKIHLRNKRS